MAQLRIQRKKSGGSGKYLQIIFKSSQVYTLESKWKSADIFLVGGGCGGGSGYTVGDTRYPIIGGMGGSGGQTQTYKDISLTSRSLNVTIGAGGIGRPFIQGSALAQVGNVEMTNGNNTVLNINDTNYTANGGRYATSGTGTGCAGATGGSHSGSSTSTGYNAGTDGGSNTRVKGQNRTTRLFAEPNGQLFAGGGGGGYAWNNIYSSRDVARGGNLSTGGGGGGTDNSEDGKQGDANTGSGGGGGCGYRNARISQAHKGGNGGSGIVIIRLFPNSDRPTDINWDDYTIVVS